MVWMAFAIIAAIMSTSLQSITYTYASGVSHSTIIQSSLRQTWQRQRHHWNNRQQESLWRSQSLTPSAPTTTTNGEQTNPYTIRTDSNNDAMNTLAEQLPPFLSAEPAASTLTNEFQFLSRNPADNAPHHTFTQVCPHFLLIDHSDTLPTIQSCHK
jgi:hypothetical protein